MRALAPHLRYLRYVLMHKLYVFRAGLLIGGWRPAWVWRLLVHDLSKFRPSEWRPYVAHFYGSKEHAGLKESPAFKAAWLRHQHRNPHHWQYWVLREDSGRTIVLAPPREVADEMLADWIGAGIKVLSWPSMAACIASTAKWYVETMGGRQLRDVPRAHIEAVLIGLCHAHGITDYEVVPPVSTITLGREASRR